MRTLILSLAALLMLSYQTRAGSIAGEISYAGTSTGTVYIAVFDSPTFDGDPIQMTTTILPGSYSISTLEDGTYYVVSIISNNIEKIMGTDPYGFWGTLEGLTPVVISGNNNVTGINITLMDGTIENPNPFAEIFVSPDLLIQLPSETIDGTNPSLVYDGTSIYLYKHDYEGGGSAKIFVLDPENGALLNTYILSLESSPNKISWIDKMIFRNGELWASGGYGDPQGTGYVEGIFKVDISTSSSSSQIPGGSEQLTTGFACDGIYFYIGVDSMGTEGIVKFNPDAAIEIPSSFFIRLDNRLRGISFGDGYLWVGTRYVTKYEPNSGTQVNFLNLQGSAAELYFDGKFWTYDESDNTLNVYNLSTVGVEDNAVDNVPTIFSLSQNYPNPFNPSTTILYSLPNSSYVKLSVYNSIGEEVRVLVDEERNAGNYNIHFDAADLTSGVYFYRLQTNSYMETKKFILVR